MTSGMDYLVVGEYDFAIQDGNKEYPFEIKVKDTTPPMFTLPSRSQSTL